MAITTDQEKCVVATIKVSGRLDALEAPALRAQLAEQVESSEVSAIVVDLSGATFVDSAGLAALVKGMRDSERAGCRYQLIKPKSEDAMRVFKLTRFADVFDMVDAVEPTVSGDVTDSVDNP